jgi:hypothetical protein
MELSDPVKGFQDQMCNQRTEKMQREQEPDGQPDEDHQAVSLPVDAHVENKALTCFNKPL